VEVSNLQPRLLGIDYGDARIGLAVSDELGFLAHPLETIHCQKTHPLKRIAEVVHEKAIAKIILGLPLRLNSTEGPAAEKVRAFAKRLQSEIPDSPIEFIDESYSTMDAQKKLHEAGRNTKNSKPIIDQAAAVVILQSYLDA
jgi:putative Holliday junction resolvase